MAIEVEHRFYVCDPDNPYDFSREVDAFSPTMRHKRIVLSTNVHVITGDANAKIVFSHALSD